MPRYKLIIEYDGTDFSGWQSQSSGNGVQDSLESALKILGEAGRSSAAGRTDTGVHALGQVVHIDLTRTWEPRRLLLALNALMRPRKVCVIDSAAVSHDFHARFTAKRREYLYRILNRSVPSIFAHQRAWIIHKKLDCEAMQEGALYLLGHHDFTTFRSGHCQAHSPLRTLDHLSILKKDEEILINIHSRSFLHHQVRSIVGSLKLVGEGKWTPSHIETILKQRSRCACGPMAPPYGLYLMRVFYGKGGQ